MLRNLGSLLLGSLLVDTLDDTDGDGLFHVTDGETAEWWVFSEGFNAHWLGWGDDDQCGVTSLDVWWVFFCFLASTSVHLGLDFGELAGNVCGVAVEDWAVAGTDLTWMVHDDDLGGEGVAFTCWVTLGVGGDETTTDVLGGDVLDVEADVVSWNGFWEGFMMHFNGLDFGGDTGWGELDDHTWLQDTGFDSADWHCADTGDLVDVLEWETEWLVGRSLWWDDGVEGFEECWALEPLEVGGFLDEVVTVEAGQWDEGDLFWGVADLLEVVGQFLLDFVETILTPVDGLVVHLVDADDHLLDTEGVGEESVLTGLAFLGDTSLELTLWGGNHENGAIGLGGAGNHVLDEISVSWGVDDGEDGLGSLELPEGDIDGDTSLSFGLELVQHPGVLEGSLSHFGGFLLELLNCSLVDATTLVDEVTS